MTVDMTQDNKQMALLKNKLQMPLIVRDLLIVDQAPISDENYALHEMMSNFQIEDALLCSAFVMKEIANFESMISTDLAFLHMECDRVIERYSSRVALAEENPDLWSETQIDMLDAIYEDMEDFLELIELCHMSYEITNPAIAKILSIMMTQLQSHMMIIDEVISMQKDTIIETNITQSNVTGSEADNVIMFPS